MDGLVRIAKSAMKEDAEVSGDRRVDGATPQDQASRRWTEARPGAEIRLFSEFA
jgi:hypothetical protein